MLGVHARKDGAYREFRSSRSIHRSSADKSVDKTLEACGCEFVMIGKLVSGLILHVQHQVEAVERVLAGVVHNQSS